MWYLCNSGRPGLKRLDGATDQSLIVKVRIHADMHLEQSSKKGDVVGPLLQCGIEQRQRSLHSRRIPTIILVFLFQC